MDSGLGHKVPNTQEKTVGGGEDPVTDILAF